MLRNPRRIATRLYFLVGLVVAMLGVLIVIALRASDEMGSAGDGLYRGVQGVSRANHAEVLWERARGLAARVPAELDLDRQQQFHDAFAAAMAEIRTTLAGQPDQGDPVLAEMLRKADDAVGAAGRSAGEVFRFAASFAQDQAVGALNGPFAAIERQLNGSLDAVSRYQKGIADRDLARLSGARRTMAWLIAAAGGLSVTVVGTIGVLLARGLSRRIARLTAVMRRLAEGDLTPGVPSATDRDEIGHMARAVEVFKQNAVLAIRLAEGQADAQAARERRHAALEQMTQDFGSAVSGAIGTLVTSTQAMAHAAEAMAGKAVGAHQQATGTAARAEQSSLDLASIAAAIEQMTASVDEITRQVAAAASVARSASERAVRNDAMMRELSGAAERISGTIRLIERIAGQTNLLALNATIEAARAGEAGKGFAVVATEVKALSRQTAAATAEIDAQVAAVRTAAENAIGAMQAIGGIVSEMDGVTAAISAAVEQQSATAREITSNVQLVSVATRDAVGSMGRVVEAIDDASDVSSTVRGGVEAIGREAAGLRSEIDQFLLAVRNNADDRRYSDRIAGGGAVVTLKVRDRPDAAARLRDISARGAALEGDFRLAAGQEATVSLPCGGGDASGRVVRCDANLLGIVFHQDPDTTGRVARAIGMMTGQADAA